MASKEKLIRLSDGGTRGRGREIDPTSPAFLRGRPNHTSSPRLAYEKTEALARLQSTAILVTLQHPFFIFENSEKQTHATSPLLVPPPCPADSFFSDPVRFTAEF